MATKQQTMPEKRRFAAVLEPVSATMDSVAGPLDSSYYKGQGSRQGGEREFVAVLEPVPFDTTQITSPLNYSSPKAGDPCHPLAAGAHPPAVAFAQNSRDEVRLMNGDGQIVGALAAQPITLEVRGRDGECSLEYRQDGTSNCLRGASGGRGGTGIGAVAFAQPIAFHPTQDPISSQDGVSHAMSNGSKSGTATVAVAVCETMHIRRLMPIEAERLQGFPDGWTGEAALSDGTVKQQADGPRYKQLGNAVTVNVAHWLANRVAILASERLAASV